jgi:hypothetical protein
VLRPLPAALRVFPPALCNGTFSNVTVILRQGWYAEEEDDDNDDYDDDDDDDD